MKTVKSQPNQTIYDLAVQYYGNTGAVGEIAANNPHLTNDPAALAALDIDYVADSGFYFDVAIRPGLDVAIDNESQTMRQGIVKDIGRQVTTFDL